MDAVEDEIFDVNAEFAFAQPQTRSPFSSTTMAGFGAAFRDLRTAYEAMFCSTTSRAGPSNGNGASTSPTGGRRSSMTNSSSNNPFAVLFIADDDERNELDHRKMYEMQICVYWSGMIRVCDANSTS